MGTPSVERFGESVRKLYKQNHMVVFLCGPSLRLVDSDPAAALRLRIQEALEAEGFEVVLGEDDGLENIRIKVSGGYAHENELEFIQRECGAIVLVAGSVGSYCELGLFAHWHAKSNENKCDLILLANAKY